MEIKQITFLRWSARILASVIFVFVSLFYFGYGNPLPFVDPDYTWIDNTQLILAPVALLGLLVGWKSEKAGGYMIITPLIAGFLMGILAKVNFSMNMLVLLLPGTLYLIVGYKADKQ